MGELSDCDTSPSIHVSQIESEFFDSISRPKYKIVHFNWLECTKDNIDI